MTTRQTVAAAAYKLNELSAVNGGLAWLERGPDASARTSVVSWTERGGAVARTPADVNVGSALHGYGGGLYAVAGDVCYAVRSDDSQIVYGQTGGPWRAALPSDADAEYCYGDLAITDEGLLGVRESSGPDAADAIVMLADGSELVLVRDDFLAAPTVGPGGRLAWLRWSDDQMPWDATELRVARWRSDYVEPPVLVAGGPNESVLEPRWGPDGALYFQSDRSGWWNLYRWDGTTVVAVAPMALDCASAPWEPGYNEYAFLAGGRIGLIQKHGYRDVLAVRQPDGEIRSLDLPYTSLRPYLVAHGDRLAMIGSSPSTGPHVVIVDPNDSRGLQVVATGTGADVPLSIPERVVLRAADGSTLNALVYAPTGASASWRAPLIVSPHPGPTDNMHERRDWRVQFFTARGYAVAAVDYRGSTGYGRAFRESLYGHWGGYDVVDCRALAEYLIDAGRAVSGQVFISGESAGGYTALKAVSDPETPFAAAVAALSIVDPRGWQETAARFQRPHARRLAGPAGAVRAAEIHRPVLLMHGSEDTIAPVRDVIELADALAVRGTPYRLIVFDGAGHGFSRPAHAEAALDAELSLYQQFRVQ